MSPRTQLPFSPTSHTKVPLKSPSGPQCSKVQGLLVYGLAMAPSNTRALFYC